MSGCNGKEAGVDAVLPLIINLSIFINLQAGEDMGNMVFWPEAACLLLAAKACQLFVPLPCLHSSWCLLCMHAHTCVCVRVFGAVNTSDVHHLTLPSHTASGVEHGSS